MKKANVYYTLITSSLAFCFWGAWAFYVNYSINPLYGIKAGLVQDSMSFLLTIGMIHLVKFFYVHSPGHMKIALPPFLTVGCTASLLYIVHALMHTPDILKIIGPPIAVALSFCSFTHYKLNLLERKKNE